MSIRTPSLEMAYWQEKSINCGSWDDPMFNAVITNCRWLLPPIRRTSLGAFASKSFSRPVWKFESEGGVWSLSMGIRMIDYIDGDSYTILCKKNSYTFNWNCQFLDKLQHPLPKQLFVTSLSHDFRQGPNSVQHMPMDSIEKICTLLRSQFMLLVQLLGPVAHKDHVDRVLRP